MNYYAALDVSLRSVHLCVIDDQGKIKAETKLNSEVTDIIAYLDAGKTKQVLLPKGSKAKVIHWPGEFLNPFPTKNEPQAALAQVKILNGPYAATQARLFIESAAIRLPDR